MAIDIDSVKLQGLFPTTRIFFYVLYLLMQERRKEEEPNSQGFTLSGSANLQNEGFLFLTADLLADAAKPYGADLVTEISGKSEGALNSMIGAALDAGLIQVVEEHKNRRRCRAFSFVDDIPSPDWLLGMLKIKEPQPATPTKKRHRSAEPAEQPPSDGQSAPKVKKPYGYTPMQRAVLDAKGNQAEIQAAIRRQYVALCQAVKGQALPINDLAASHWAVTEYGSETSLRDAVEYQIKKHPGKFITLDPEGRVVFAQTIIEEVGDMGGKPEKKDEPTRAEAIAQRILERYDEDQLLAFMYIGTQARKVTPKRNIRTYRLPNKVNGLDEASLTAWLQFLVNEGLVTEGEESKAGLRGHVWDVDVELYLEVGVAIDANWPEQFQRPPPAKAADPAPPSKVAPPKLVVVMDPPTDDASASKDSVVELERHVDRLAVVVDDKRTELDQAVANLARAKAELETAKKERASTQAGLAFMQQQAEALGVPLEKYLERLRAALPTNK